MKEILFISNNNFGEGLSGGDRIFLNFIKYWQKNLKITLMGSQETYLLLQKYNTTNISFIKTDQINKNSKPTVINILKHQIKRTIKGIYLIKYINLTKYDYIYSVSDFYPDLLPALIIKILKPKIKWFAGYYLFAPNPLSTSSPYIHNKEFLKGLVYFLGQLPSRLIVNLFSNTILVTSEPDISKFKSKKVVVVQGGVDTKEAQDYLKSNKQINPLKRKYDACFIGRLHPQKGVLELIDIWKLVTKNKPQAKLAIIGNGDLEEKVREKIIKLNLKSNIEMLGFLDGVNKYQIFKNSKIVLHPATYDSGGMAAAEAMAWGLPGVSFDLQALKTYYPKGMLKTPIGNYYAFSKNILKLLNDQNYYKNISLQAIELTTEVWSWPKKCTNLYNQIFS